LFLGWTFFPSQIGLLSALHSTVADESSCRHRQGCEEPKV